MACGSVFRRTTLTVNSGRSVDSIGDTGDVSAWTVAEKLAQNAYRDALDHSWLASKDMYSQRLVGRPEGFYSLLPMNMHTNLAI